MYTFCYRYQCRRYYFSSLSLLVLLCTTIICQHCSFSFFIIPQIQRRFQGRLKTTTLTLNKIQHDKSYLNGKVNDDDNNNEAHLFIFGLGNLGLSIAEIASYSKEDQLRTLYNTENINYNNSTFPYIDLDSSFTIKFDSICGTTTGDISTALSEINCENNIIVIEFNDTQRIEQELRKATHILVTVPIIQNTTTSTKQSFNNNNSDNYYLDPILDSPDHFHLFSVPTHKNNTDNSSEVIVGKNKWVGFASTTGVYGNHNGDWVNEESDLKLNSNIDNNRKAMFYRRSEEKWAAIGYQNKWNINIFRISGLYGNKFSALHTCIKKLNTTATTTTEASSAKQVEEKKFKTPLSDTSKPSIKNYVSRIHLSDVSRAIFISMSEHHHVNNNDNNNNNNSVKSKSHPKVVSSIEPQIYNLADDEPCPRSTVMSYTNELLYSLDDENLTNVMNSVGIKRRLTSATSVASSSSSERSKRRVSDNKRVSNEKLKRLLLEDFGGLKYPTYKEGLNSILNNMKKDS